MKATLLVKATLLAAVLGVLSGCGGRAHERRPAPPPPVAQSTVVVSWGWTHHRYVVWREYYGCDHDEIYYIENCGYDDDDVLTCLYIARRARVPLRHVFYEYERCGRSHFTVAMSFRLPWDIWFVREVPRGYGCPPVYARAYGHYWRGERHYYANDEIHLLVQLQIGVLYYGHSHASYFTEYDSCVRRGERAPFRTIVVKDHRHAGRGGRGWDERPVAHRDRPWNAPTPQEWERRRQAEREQVKIRHTPQREREEAERAQRAIDARHAEREEAKRQMEAARARRMEEDRKHEAEERARGPKDPPGRPERDPGRPANEKGPEKKPEAPRGPDRRPEERAPERKPEPPKAPERGPEKKPEAPRGHENKPEERRPEPPKAPERGPERKNDAPPPPPRTEPRPPPREAPQKGPEKPPEKTPQKGPEKKKKADDDN